VLPERGGGKNIRRGKFTLLRGVLIKYGWVAREGGEDKTIQRRRENRLREKMSVGAGLKKKKGDLVGRRRASFLGSKY